MMYQLYVIRDVVSKEYLAPMVDQSDATALRNFRHTILTSGGTISTHPQDFELWRIGDYDSELGDIDTCTPVLIARGGDFK